MTHSKMTTLAIGVVLRSLLLAACKKEAAMPQKAAATSQAPGDFY